MVDELERFAVVYGKFADDKELGVYLEGVYLGGLATTVAQADDLCRQCTNTVRGIFVRKYAINGSNTLPEIMGLASDQFNRMERQMFEAEESIARSKSRR